jgi:hypothetical protein
MSKSLGFKIIRIAGSKAQSLGYIRAPNESAAVKKWIEDYDVSDPSERARIIAREQA